MRSCPSTLADRSILNPVRLKAHRPRRDRQRHGRSSSIGTNPKFRLDTLKRFQGGIDRLHRRAKDADRDPKTIGLAYRVTQRGKAIPERADDGDRRLFSGDDAAIVGDLRAIRDLGVSDVDFSFDGTTADEVIANMKRFREDVLAKV